MVFIVIFLVNRTKMDSSFSSSQETSYTQEEVATQPLSDLSLSDYESSEAVQRPTSWGCVNGINFRLPTSMYFFHSEFFAIFTLIKFLCAFNKRPPLMVFNFLY